MLMGEKKRFPAPWRVMDGGGRRFIVVDGDGVEVARVEFMEAPARDYLTLNAPYILTPDEARRTALGIARLPELLGKQKG